MITVWSGARAHRLLFDTGPDEVVFERSVERLGFDVSSVEGMVLSHGSSAWGLRCRVRLARASGEVDA